MLQGINLNKSVRGQKIVDGANIELAPGQIAVIIGPSGAGKTSLLKLLAMLDLPDSGSVIVDDTKFEFPAPAIQSPPWPHVTVVFQQLFLWPHLTLRQNIELPLRLKKGDYKGPERRTANPQSNDANSEQRRLSDLLELFEMNDFVDRYPNQASLGQRQRAALVRALVLQPQYLLLDEITSSLDVEQVSIILSYLKRLATKGIGILLITHLLNFAREAADKIIFMESGQVIESGGKEVISAPKQDRIRKFLSVIESAS